MRWTALCRESASDPWTKMTASTSRTGRQGSLRPRDHRSRSRRRAEPRAREPRRGPALRESARMRLQQLQRAGRCGQSLRRSELVRWWWASSCQPGNGPCDSPCVKWSAPHFGQCRNASACWFCAEIAPTCLLRSVESVVSQVFDVTHKSENMRNDLVRRRLAHLGTCQVYPHSAQVLVYSVGCHGNRMRRSSPRDGDQPSASPATRPVRPKWAR